TRLVNDLLLLARADAGQVTPRREAVDLGDLALEVVERLEPVARQRGVALTTGELPELVVAGDRAYLTRMLTNLVENAIKYTRGIGTRVRVEAGECCAGEGARGWVR